MTDTAAALGQLHHRCSLVRDALAGDPLQNAMDAAAVAGFAELARLLRTLEELRATAGVAASLVNTLMAEVATQELEVVDGLGTFERKPGAKRKKWAHEAALADVYAWALEPEHRQVDGGEPGELVPAAEAVRDAITAAAAFAYWRVGALKAMGLNPDSYSESERAPAKLVARWVEPLTDEPAADVIERRGPDEEAAA